MAVINGTDGGNVLGGGIGSDTIRGRRGDDTLIGGGQVTFVIRLGDGTTTITDFGGIGTGIRPTSEVIAEVDTLQFEGAGLMAENLLLTQQDDDLLISFENVQDTQVVLQDFALENVDNLQRSTGAAVDLGNILFNGQSQIQDSFDVFNADQQRLSVFNLNTVTFLNDLDNTTEGHNGSDDVINAQGGNDYITGLTGNDLLRGGAGNDSLDGGGTEIREVDILTGGAGEDRFILSSLSRIYYDNGNPATAGRADYALITAFNTSEDVIQLKGQQSDYRLGSSPTGLPAGRAIYRDKPGEEPDELIGIVQGSPNLSLDSDSFSFISAEFNLSELDGRNGFVINGIDPYDQSGRSVSNAGDVNGDGFDDLIIGAPGAGSNGQASAGESYVVLGSREGSDASFDLSELNGNNGFVINGVDEYDQSGRSVSTAGDVNGDGFDDLIVGTPIAGPYGVDVYAGKSYVVFGSGEGFDASFDLAELNGSNGFVINGIREYDRSGYSVSTAGDVNGDGFDDLLIGAPQSAYIAGEPGGGVGESYVVFGSGEGFDASFDLTELNGSNGFAIQGIDRIDLSGTSVSTAGDVNGDGFDDLLIGAPAADPNGQDSVGESYVVFGREEGFDASFDLTELNGSNGFAIQGIDRIDLSGTSVSTAGDVNGDGFDDLLIGAPAADPNGQDSVGESYVVFGREEGFDASFDLTELNGSNGFVINGIDVADNSGRSVSTAGDVNGDGFDDLIVGAPGADPNGQERAGQSYVVFGRGEGFAASFDLAKLNGRNGFVLNGDELDLSGRSVSDAGDINGDGFNDLIVGAPGPNPAGKSYVVFGRDFTGQGSFQADALLAQGVGPVGPLGDAFIPSSGAELVI